MKEWQSKHRDNKKSPQGGEGSMFGGKNTAIQVRTMATAAATKSTQSLLWLQLPVLVVAGPHGFQPRKRWGALPAFHRLNFKQKQRLCVWNLYFWLYLCLHRTVLQCVAMCCKVLQSVAKCCKVLQSVALLTATAKVPLMPEDHRQRSHRQDNQDESTKEKSCTAWLECLGIGKTTQGC